MRVRDSLKVRGTEDSCLYSNSIECLYYHYHRIVYVFYVCMWVRVRERGRAVRVLCVNVLCARARVYGSIL